MVSRYRLGGDGEAWGGWLGVQMPIPISSLWGGAAPLLSLYQGGTLGEGLNLRAAEPHLNPPLSFRSEQRPVIWAAEAVLQAGVSPSPAILESQTQCPPGMSVLIPTCPST